MDSGARRAAWEGLRTSLVVGGVVVCAIAPSRWVLSSLEESGGARTRAFLLGLMADSTSAIVLVGLVALGAMLARARPRRARALVAAAGLGLWLFTVSSSESCLSRGVFASWVDLRILWNSPEMMQSSAAMFTLPRNLIPTAALLLPAVLVLKAWPVAGPTPRGGAVYHLLFLAFVATACGVGSAGAESPFDLLAPRAWPEAFACLADDCGPRGHLERGSVPSSEEVARGAAMLGWPPPADAAAGAHPFARAFPALERESPSVRAARLLQTLDSLSTEILSRRGDRPLHVWLVALEGMRGDDLHPLNPSAPRSLAPLLSSLYDRSAAPAPEVLASRHTYAAGLRTPHGVAAALCGLGTLPYGLTLSRDLPDLAVRCLPDVLTDAGVRVGFAYGGEPMFDGLGPWLARHGAEDLLREARRAPEAPRGAWGLSDRAVHGAAVDAAAAAPGSTFTFVLTLSHHHPFPLPDDLPPAVRSAAEAAFTTATPGADREDERRLVTFAYADAALAELLESLKRRDLYDDSIVIVTADHSIPDRRLWGGSRIDAPQSRALVPLVVSIAPALFERAAHPDAARSLAKRAQEELDDLALSQNDIPLLVLSLLGRSPSVEALGERAWHTLGGQATSPWYRPPGPETTRVHGIHAGTALYFFDDEGHAVAPEEPAPLVATPELAREVAPSLQPAAAPLGLLVHAPPASTEAMTTK